jgi:hypothetical protein
MFLKSVSVAALLVLAGTAQAQVGVSADLGSTGAGVHLVVPMASNLNGRFGGNYLQHDFDRTSNGAQYLVKGKLQTFDMLLDWYVLDGSTFHLTGGLVYNGNRFAVTSKANQQGLITVNGHTYSAATVGELKGSIDYRKAAPYLGIGWGNALAADRQGHWSFNTDLGVFYQGKSNFVLGSDGCTAAQTVCNTLNQDIAKERLRLADDADSLRFYPVVRASLNYRF